MINENKRKSNKIYVEKEIKKKKEREREIDSDKMHENYPLFHLTLLPPSSFHFNSLVVIAALLPSPHSLSLSLSPLLMLSILIFTSLASFPS